MSSSGWSVPPGSGPSGEPGRGPWDAHRSNAVAPPGWYPDPAVPGRLRYWSGESWTDATAAASGHAAAPAAAWPPPPPAPLGTARRRGDPVVGALLVSVGALVLLACLGFGGALAWDIASGSRVEATIVDVVDGWCTYDWPGKSGGDEDYDGDYCDPSSRIGDEVQIFVTSEGVAWASVTSFVGPLPGFLVVALLVGGLLLGSGVWLLLRR